MNTLKNKNKNFNNQKEILTINIENVNINGEGYCFVGNSKVCVKNVLPNEIVEVEKVFEKQNFIKAKLLKVKKPNKERIVPKCKYYGICGGCDCQFLENESALQLKKQIFEDYFKDLYQGTIEIQDSKEIFEYRNKASFAVLNQKIGLQKEGSNEVVEIDNCLIVKPEINKTLQLLKSWLEKTKNTKVNHAVVRVLNKKISLVLVCSETPNDLEKLIDGLKILFLEGNFGLYLNFNKSRDFILSNKFKHIYGLKFLEDVENKINYFVHPYSFMQVNDFIRNKIYSFVLSQIENKDVIEGYSGAGLLSAIISTKAKRVIGVEINKEATLSADKLKEFNKIINLENINGDCATVLPVLAKKYPNSIFVIDPPRSGCDVKTLNAIIENEIKKIIYVSCNPYTLKQNIKFLSSKYKVKSLKIFNMFPQTFETEMVAILEKI